MDHLLAAMALSYSFQIEIQSMPVDNFVSVSTSTFPAVVIMGYAGAMFIAVRIN